MASGGVGWGHRPSPTTERIDDIFVTASTAIAVGSRGTVLRTADAGQSWSLQPSGTVTNLFAVFMSDIVTGTAVGLGFIYRTTDGGGSWAPRRQPVNFTIDESYSDVWLTDPNTAIVVAGLGTILRTTDGGAHWTAQTSGSASWPAERLLHGPGQRDGRRERGNDPPHDGWRGRAGRAQW